MIRVMVVKSSKNVDRPTPTASCKVLRVKQYQLRVKRVQQTNGLLCTASDVVLASPHSGPCPHQHRSEQEVGMDDAAEDGDMAS